ncbi:hypothetical protein WJX77_011008 [Trebouxia sp. C0004]
MYSAAPFVCSLAITNSSFSNNTVPLNGGAFASRFDGYAVAIILSTFTSNQITPAGGPGAAFSMTPMITAGDLSTLLVISQSNFTGNVASDALGCLSVQQDACVAIQSCIFASNTASTGGATFTTQVNSDESNCFNQALALQTIPRPLPDAPALFDPLNPGPAPEAAPEGSSEPEAAPEPFSPVILDIRGSQFLNNSATGTTGGALALGSVISAAAIVNCTFVSNASPDVGGAITIFSNSLVTIAGTSFVANQAPSSKRVGVTAYKISAPTGVFMAAHVAAGWISCYVAILDCTVQRNAKTSTQPGASFDDLQGSGRVIWTNAPLLWIHNSSFVGNAAATLGGAVLYIATALPADSEHLEYEYRAEAEYPSPEDSLIHSAINAAQVKNSSSFIMSAAHLAGQSTQGSLRACKLSVRCTATPSLADPVAPQQLQTQLNASSSLVPAAASRLCASWIEGQNSSPGYGHLMALPAQQRQDCCCKLASKMVLVKLLLQQEVKPCCVSVQVRGCQLGEVVGAEGNVCDPCLPGQYSFNTTSPICDMMCPDSAQCSGGVVLPKKGDWHLAAKATRMHPCPNQAACQGSRAALQCSPGYQGRLPGPAVKGLEGPALGQLPDACL